METLRDALESDAKELYKNCVDQKVAKGRKGLLPKFKHDKKTEQPIIVDFKLSAERRGAAKDTEYEAQCHEKLELFFRAYTALCQGQSTLLVNVQQTHIPSNKKICHTLFLKKWR